MLHSCPYQLCMRLCGCKKVLDPPLCLLSLSDQETPDDHDDDDELKASSSPFQLFHSSLTSLSVFFMQER